MGKQRKLIVSVFAGLLAAYVVVALTPIKSLIGRYSPAAASVFSPFLFNFSRTYESGNVLEFRIGMTRKELFETLRSTYAGRADLTVDCSVTTAESVVPITSELDVGTAYGGGQRLCARLDSRRLGVVVGFQGDLVSAIEVWFVRNEFP